MATMTALISSKVWFLFIAPTVVLFVGSPAHGFVGIRGLSLERLCTLFHKCWPKQRSIQSEISVRQAKHDSAKTTIDPVRNDRLSGQTRLISSCDNVKHDFESLLEQIGFSSFLSLARFITFSPPRTRSKPPSLEASYPFPPFNL